MEENSEYVHLVTHHQRRFRISPEARYGRAAGWHAVNFHTQKAVLATGATGMTYSRHGSLVTLGALDATTNDRNGHLLTATQHLQLNQHQ